MFQRLGSSGFRFSGFCVLGSSASGSLGRIEGLGVGMGYVNPKPLWGMQAQTARMTN